MHITKTSIALAAFLAGCGAATVASQLVVPSARAGTNPARWEYTCANAQPEYRSDLDGFNRAGAQGWELAAGAGQPGARTWCFKRQLP